MAKGSSEIPVQALCMNCEYFDGGGMALVAAARESYDVLHGDCLNRKGPNFETKSTDTCSFFYLDSTTWPAERAL